jgi:hypothetical protein
MTSFSKLQRFKVSSQTTVRYDLGFTMGALPDQEPKNVVLVLAPATGSNAELLNDVLRERARRQREEATTQKGRRRRPGRAEPVKSVETQMREATEARDLDREKFAKFVVKGWENVFDDTNTVSPHSEANCLDFLRALPDEIFDDVRVFCYDASNFQPTEVEGLAKN